MIYLICGPARCGKDTIANYFEKYYKKKCLDKILYRFSFAQKLKEECEQYIKDNYNVSVWDDSKKHIFRQYLIDYGQKKREQSNGLYFINEFIDQYHLKQHTVKILSSDLTTNFEPHWIITDYRFFNEYKHIKENCDTKIIPIYLHRYKIINNKKEYIDPTIPDEVKEYPIIKENALVWEIPWYNGWFWKWNLYRDISKKIHIINHKQIFFV